MRIGRSVRQVVVKYLYSFSVCNQARSTYDIDQELHMPSWLILEVLNSLVSEGVLESIGPDQWKSEQWKYIGNYDAE